MDNERVLSLISEELTKQGLSCVTAPSENNQKRLLVYAGSDPQDRTQLIEIKSQSRGIKGEEYTSVQIDAFFPFVAQDLAMQDVAQFLNILNLQMEIPGFCLNYLDNTLLHRYVLLSEGSHFPLKTLVFLVGMAMFYQDVFSSPLERLASGKISFIEIMKEIESLLRTCSKSSIG